MTQTTVPAVIDDGFAQKSALPVRVAFVVSQFPETHETFILRELAALADEGLDFVIFSLKPCMDTVIQQEARRFLERTFYPMGWQPRAGPRAGFTRSVLASGNVLPWFRRPVECAYVAWAAARLSRTALALEIGHIHAHWATAPTSAAVLMSRMLAIPYSFTAHAWDIYAGDGRLASKAKGARFIATCTRANVEHIRSLLPAEEGARVVLNYHGVGQPPEKPKDSRGVGIFRIAAVGRLVETKGFGYLLDALERVDFPFELTIVGAGPLRGRLERQAASQRLAGRVRFTGVVPVEEVYRVLCESDIFVMPSVVAKDGDRDGIPNVLLEAMSVGLPVVASGISGIPEAVVDGRTGILTPEKDSQAIRAAISRLYANQWERTRMGDAGREFVRERFDAVRNARSLFQVFKDNVGARLG